MKVTFWGTRGSTPVSGTQFVEHGGSTTCIAVELGAGQNVIFDCGTGLASMGRELGTSALDAQIFQTHMHWDHVQGFPFFAPLFHPDTTLTLHAVARENHTLQHVLRDQMSGPTFPITLEHIPATLEFATCLPTQGSTTLKEATISWMEMVHPSGSTAYRVDAHGCSFVFTGDLEVQGMDEDAVMAFVKDADILVMDSQYLPEEYESRRGFGHSTYEDAVRIALGAGVKNLFLTHHDPTHDDTVLNEKLRRARAFCQTLGGPMLGIHNASDGRCLKLSGLQTSPVNDEDVWPVSW